MAIRPFLAMTPAEIRNTSPLPEKTAWMACHFSPYGSGLSNIPRLLPEGSLLIIDDVTPFHGHNPECIANQLIQCITELNSAGILLDFQRPENPETAELIQYLSLSLPCPLAVSDIYADAADLPVFVPPVPPSISLSGYLSKWKRREIWLDIGLCGEILTLTEDGCEDTPLPPWEFPEEGFSGKSTHCHYHSEQKEDSIVFKLWRTAADISCLLEEAAGLGITQAVGLYQEYALTAKTHGGD